MTDSFIMSNLYSFNPKTTLSLTRTETLLCSLFQLVLRDNDLIALPKEIGELTRLKELHIQGNRLTVLPPELGERIGYKDMQIIHRDVQPNDKIMLYREGHRAKPP